MSQSKKRKNANYTLKSRQQASAPLKPIQKKKPATVTKKGKTLRPPREPGPISRFLINKNNILDPKPGKRQFNYCILSFLIPFLGVLFVMAIRAFAMEQNNNTVFSILYSDSYYQYYPFFLDFRRNILSGEGLLYSWNAGMGLDYSGLYAYYLGSPLNWLSILMPESWMLDYYTFLVPVRIGLASLFFSIFLKKIFNRNDISIALFGSFYATCAWAFGYMWNTMWLDTFALLPLVILGTVNLLNSRKFILYTVALCLSIAINYYIGLFTCIFTLLVFICYEICRWKGFKKFLTDFALMGLFTIIAIGMTAIITLPAYANLQTTVSSNNSFPTKLTMHIAKENTVAEFFKAFIKVATNTYASMEPNDKSAATAGGLPNIYCGLCTSVLVVLFFTCKQVKWRDRIAALVLLIFLNCSFILKPLDYIWHGFHFTNEIPNRFSFIYSFVMLYMAYRTWSLRRQLRPWQILTAASLLIIGMFLSPGYAAFLEDTKDATIWTEIKNVLTTTHNPSSLSNLMTPEVLFPFVNGILLICYLGFLFLISFRSRPHPRYRWHEKRIWYIGRKTRRAIGTIGLLVVIFLELSFNIICFGMQFNTTNVYGYPRGGEDSAKMIQYMKDLEGEDTFYRAEAAQHQTYNDGVLNNYNGISIFTSSANVRVTNYLRAIGLSGYKTYNRVAYEESSPIVNMFVNLKYILERQNYVENNPYFTDIQQSGKVHLLQNNYYLPLGFLVDPEMPELFYSVGSIDMEHISSAKKAQSDTQWTPMYPKGKPDNGSWSEWKADSVTHFATVSNIGYLDIGALHMKASTGNHVAIAIDAGMKSGKTYTLTLYAKGTSDSSRVLALYDKQETVIIADGARLSEQWQAYTVTFTASDRQLNLYAPGMGDTELFIDNISLTDENGKNLLSNTGGFYSTEINTASSMSFQNKLLSAALGRDVAAFTQISDSNVKISTNDQVTLSAQTGHSCTYDSKSSSGKVFFNFKIDQEGLFCINYNMPAKNNFTVSYKAAGSDKFTTVHKDGHNGLAYISSICQVYPGDEIQITIDCKAESGKKLTLDGAILNQDVMDEAYAELSQSTLQIHTFEQTLLEGTIDCKKSGLMYTSLPQTGNNWHVYVDGKEAEIILIGDVMIGVMLEEGSHTITFRYQNKALLYGAIISTMCLICLVVLTFFAYIFPRLRSGKFVKKEQTIENSL